ncbi:MAG: MFS transporter [Bryobacterales bacterium]|nr:MFS transporter [Bryobacterales bacterium]
MRPFLPARWLAVGAFTLFTALNYLDRQTLAALAPQLKTEFHLSNEDYGWLQSAFYIVYALCAPIAGLFIDRVGLSAGAMVSIVVWSLAAAATGLVDGLAGLFACRMLLGAAEAGGIPAFGKASATYLHPSERALGTGVNQLGLSLGSMAAPLLAFFLAERFGWRAAFVAAGGVGLFWVPLWRAVHRRAGEGSAVALDAPVSSASEVARDRRLWTLVFGNILVMTVYSLWTNWTTIFLVQQYHLSPAEANQRYAWIPPIFATFGGLFGGWLALRLMKQGATVMQARDRSILAGCIALLATMAVPLMREPGWAIAMVSVSFFCSVAVSANMYALPQDIFGARRAAFAVAAITSGYGLMLTFFSPLVGRLVDGYGFLPVCILSSALPLAGWALLKSTTFRQEAGA